MQEGRFWAANRPVCRTLREARRGALREQSELVKLAASTYASPVMQIHQQSRMYLSGHTGLVGSAIARALTRHGYCDVVTRDVHDLDMRDQAAVRADLAAARPDVVIVAAAKVGGIMANWQHPYEFVADNLSIELNLIDAAYRSGVRRLIFLGSSCIYPREAPQPLREEYLLSGPLEETNRPYAVAKIAGIELCRSLNREYGTDYVSLMPTNLYGPGDNFDLETSHVLPALIRRFHEAKADGRPTVTLWGSGAPRREFLHVDDVAEAVVFALRHVSAAEVPDGLLNVGCGEDLAISQLAEVVRTVVGYSGGIEWDTSKPDGTPRKLMDVSRLFALGWRPRVPLEDGLRSTYGWFLAHRAEARL
jgi:GDP-L-fucose synthase